MNAADYNELRLEAERVVRSGADDEQLLGFLRQRGATKVDSIKLIRVLKNLPLRAADDLVHYSTTWADRREHDEKALDTFLDSVDDVMDFDDLEDKTDSLES